jgi:hypothetical protein
MLRATVGPPMNPMSPTEAIITMYTLFKWIAAPMLAVGLMAITDTPTAEAQGFSFGTRGLSIQFGSRYPSYYTRAPRSYQRYNSHQYHYQSPFRHHTGHYDYHPTQIYRHNNHYDVVPGHFDYHDGPHYRSFGHH